MKKILHFIFAFICILNLRSQVGYHIQTPIAFNGGTSSLDNDSMYMSVGTTNNSHMMYINATTKEWKYINTANLPNSGLPIVKDKNNGILHMSNGAVQVTTDGWQTVTNSTMSLQYVNKCPAGYYGYTKLSTNSFSLHYSGDGLNWNQAQPTGYIMAMRNYGNKVVALAGFSQSYVSLNGGQTYTTVANTGTFTGTFLEFHMASADTFLVVMNNTLCKSFNGGATWTNTPLPWQITSVAIKNKNEFAVTPQLSSGTFSYTTDGGATWLSSVNPGPIAGAGTVRYFNNYYYYMYPYFRTNDYGATWDHFLPDMQGLAFSVDFNGNKGLLGLKSGQYSYSLDKGRTFKYSANAINSGQDMMAVKVLSNGNFLAGDRKGQVYTSNDNGQTWIKKNTESLNPNARRFLTSVNENTIIATRAGLPVVSIDAGNTFSVVVYSVSGGNHLQAIKPNGEMLDIRETSGWETRTFDITGATTVISTYTVAGSETIVAFYMTSNTVGYVITRDNTNMVNKVYRTADGGLTFTPKTDIGQVVAGSAAYINSAFSTSVPFISSFGTDTIIISANPNNYYHVSYDGATTWNTITPAFVPGNTTYGSTTYRMNFFTHNTYFAVTGDAFGPKGLYINTTGTAGPSIGINELNFENRNDKVVLFPNPSQKDNLVSLLNMDEETQIDIYNMSGQLVKTLTTNSGTFSIEDLHAGLYVVQVKEKDKTVRTAKLVVQ